MTAKEFLKQKDEELGAIWTEDDDSIIEAFKEFAQYHVQKALRAASEEVTHDIDIDWVDYYDFSKGHNGIKGDIDKESILNAYPTYLIR